MTIEERLAALEDKLAGLSVVREGDTRCGVVLAEALGLDTDYWMRPGYVPNPHRRSRLVVDSAVSSNPAQFWVTVPEGVVRDGEVAALHATSEDAHRHGGIGRNIAISARGQSSDHGNTAVRAIVTYGGGSAPSQGVLVEGYGLMPGDAGIEMVNVSPHPLGPAIIRVRRALGSESDYQVPAANTWGGMFVFERLVSASLQPDLEGILRWVCQWQQVGLFAMDSTGRLCAGGPLVVFGAQDLETGWQMAEEGGHLVARRVTAWGQTLGDPVVLA
jgi:hypothetical protein